MSISTFIFIMMFSSEVTTSSCHDIFFPFIIIFQKMFVAAIRDPAGAIMNYVGVQVEVRRKTIKINVKWT